MARTIQCAPHSTMEDNIMTHGGETGRYGLSQFGPENRPSWIDDYNVDMQKIDENMYSIDEKARTIELAYLSKTQAAEKYVTKETFEDEIDGINGSISKNNEEIRGITSNIGTINEETRSINENITGIENTIDEIKTGTIKPVLYPKRNIVVFGDSWTTVQSGAFINALKAKYDVESVHNYGVGGHKVQDIASQVRAYKSDATFDHSKVTNVIVVVGTNNVFWDRPVTYQEALTVAKTIRDAFPEPVRIDYFPDNSRTINGGRNSRYADILQAFAVYMAVHPEFLWIVGYNNGELFKGDDTDGVQHLTADGYKRLADWVYSTINGSYLGDIAGSALVQVTPGPNSDVTFPAQNVRIRYTGAYTHITGRIRNVTWAEKEGINKRNPKIEFVFNTSVSPNTLPVPLQSDMVLLFVGGQLYAGYFSNNSFKGSYMNEKTQDYTFNEITFETYTRASYNLNVY